MSNMKFDVECVRNCLVKNGIVFTVRSYLYNSNWSKFEDKWIKRFLIKEVECKSDLRDFLKLSGFNSVDEWWEKIEMFCKDKKKYLYLVFVLGQLDSGARGE